MKNSTVKVTCYSGHTYAERPKSFEWQGITYDIDKIEKAWQEPGIRLFQIKTTDDKRFRLYYNKTDQQWSITELVGS